MVLRWFLGINETPADEWDSHNADLFQAPGSDPPGQNTPEYEQWQKYSGDKSELEPVSTEDND